MIVRFRLPAIVILVVSLFSACQAGVSDGAPTATRQTLSLIPEPQEVVQRDGWFILKPTTKLICVPADRACAWIVDYFSSLTARTRGLMLAAPRRGTVRAVHGAIIFRRRHVSASPEGYRLAVTPDGVTVSAGTDAGLFYGAVTLWQLASQKTGPAKQIDIPAVDISDAPRFAWRGLLLDSARHYQSPSFIKSFIDAMALHKLNVLQWHLTDDQGWRLEIKRYPKLTSVGAWRTTVTGARYGGFYTQAEVRDIVAYARRRHVTIVPEIEMPGHALAAIVSYPKLGSVPHPPKTVSGDWGVFPYLYNVDDSTFGFLENVLKEVMALFPGRYIHVGGDEAVKDQWEASPHIRDRMRLLHVKDADALQGYFVRRIGRFLAVHGHRPVGWDEILDENLARNAVVTSWHGVNGAIQGARLGHDVVLAPSPALYFDNCQVIGAGEPPCRGTLDTLEEVYDFDPAPSELDTSLQSHILGVQANIWTEHIRRDDLVAYAAFPRAAALAEVGWTSVDRRSWPSFLVRLPAQLDRYRALGIPHSESALTVHVTAEPAASGAHVSLSNQTRFGEIRYTLDGTVPTVASPLYGAPFETALPAIVKATAFLNGRALTAPVTDLLDARSMLRRSSYAMQQCTNDLPLALQTSSAVFMVNVMNPCWIYRDVDLSGIAGFEAAVAHVPFNFQIGDDIRKIPLDPDAAPDGQLEIRLDTCQGERLAVLPLSSAARTDALATLRAPLPQRRGVHDLCIRFARRSVDPVWAVDWMQLVPGIAR